MKLAEFILVVFTVGTVLTGIADAAVTAWTNPVIATPTGSGSIASAIAESATTLSITIAATASGTPTYAIVSQTTAGLVTIVASTGVLGLTTGRKFDFETAPLYKLVIKCTDSDGGAAGTATVTLTITDENEAPAFARSQFSVTIPDGSTAGTKLISVAAPDDDGDSVSYDITSTNTDWAIDDDGVIKVASGITLDQSGTGGYMIQVEASDAALISTATVWVAVMTCKASAVVVGTMTMILVVATIIV